MKWLFTVTDSWYKQKRTNPGTRWKPRRHKNTTGSWKKKERTRLKIWLIENPIIINAWDSFDKTAIHSERNHIFLTQSRWDWKRNLEIFQNLEHFKKKYKLYFSRNIQPMIDSQSFWNKLYFCHMYINWSYC